VLALADSPIDVFNTRAHREAWPVSCYRADAFENEALQDIAEVWDAVRGDKPMPARADFSARSLSRHLSYVTFIEIVWPAAALTPRYRIGFFGSRLSLFAGDITGRFVDEAIEPQLIPTWYSEFGVAVSLRRPVRFVSRVRAFRLQFVSAETVLAPLADAKGEVAGFLLGAAFNR
jgi:hypothetical protein